MKALVTTDGSPLSASIFSAVEDVLGELPNLELSLLKVLDPRSVHSFGESHGQALARLRDEELAQLREVAASFRGRTVDCHTVWSTEPADAIVQMARALGADIIVMSTHGRSGLTQLVTGSVSGDVVRSAGLPVLVQRPRKEVTHA